MTKIQTLPEHEMSASNRTPTARERAIDALASGMTQEEAALLSGVNARTIRRWLDSGLDLEVRIARAAQRQRTTGRLIAAAFTAADTLAEIVTDQESPPSVRVRAAAVVLSTTLLWCDNEELERRVLAIEESLRLSRS